MFFIFGTPRSGTTLIAQCLSAHPDILVPNETDFIVPAALIYDRIADPREVRAALKILIPNTRHFQISIGEYLSGADVAAIIDAFGDTFDSLMANLYAAVAAKGGAKLAGDKSPNDLPYVHAMQKHGLFNLPTQIIHVVRDVRDVLAAVLEQNWIPTEKDGALQFVHFWAHRNMNLHRMMKDEPNYLLVRYEDFTADPRLGMERILQQLGHDFQDGVLEEARRHPRYRGQAHHPFLYEPISTARAGSYKTRLSRDLRAMCEKEGVEAMALFGY